MKREDQWEEHTTTPCPDCGKDIKLIAIRNHIRQCNKYVPTYVNNVKRCLEFFEPKYLHFLYAQMDIIKEIIMNRIRQGKTNGKEHRQAPPKQASQPQRMLIQNQQSNKKMAPPVKQIPENSQKQTFFKKEKEQQAKLEKNVGKVTFQGTLVLDQLDEDVFMDQRRPVVEENITCVYSKCKEPANINDIEKFTYLDQCLHTICLFCLRDYIRNNYVRLNGQLKCPGQCDQLIPYVQIKQVMDANVLLKLQNELNGKNLGLIDCQKCHQVYQFEKGKPADAPKKTPQGKSVTASMAKHYAENRFQCPKCRTQQCQKCKEMPYHLGFTCEDFQDHKLKKKCRYCHAVLPKGYMSQTGIKALDDICDSEQCSAQAREACSKMHPCGHPCFGVIRQKKCIPCLNQKCAAANSQELRGQNEKSYCSLCYVQDLSEAPCVRSSCGHIFHFKCLKKRMQLKWETARISFRFCECPLCNKWLELPEQSSLTKVLNGFKALQNKIKEKALKRLAHEQANKDEALKDPKSPYYKNEEKYAMTIYAYFECFKCHQPYFGGRKSCAQAMGQRQGAQKFDPKELVCAGCCPVQTTDCKKHGKDYISFKCRFCCEVAQWFCWGNTHFCEGCHKRQINGEYISRIPKDKLPKCLGKGRCPVGGDHGENGEQFCLGCGVCRGQRMDIKDF